ncbi:translation initiation factor eIF3 subunit, partial [Clydaea vesicula]
DLIFTTSKDNKPNIWYSHNGEKLGTFDGHKGTVWDIACDHLSKTALSAGADSTMRLWDVQTGKSLFVWKFVSGCRSVDYSQGEI